jgi:hypothetical protein
MKKLAYIAGCAVCLLLAGVCFLGTVADERHLFWGVLMVCFIVLAVILGKKTKRTPWKETDQPVEPVPTSAFTKPATGDVVAAAHARVAAAEARHKEFEAGAAARAAEAKAKIAAMSREELAEHIRQTSAAMVPKSADEKPGIYDREYVCVGIYRPKDISGPMPQVGDYLEAEEEPDNPYDSGAILLRDFGGAPVGYFNKTKLREAVRIALEDAAPMTIQVSRADSKLEVFVGIDNSKY